MLQGYNLRCLTYTLLRLSYTLRYIGYTLCLCGFTLSQIAIYRWANFGNDRHYWQHIKAV